MPRKAKSGKFKLKTSQGDFQAFSPDRRGQVDAHQRRQGPLAPKYVEAHQKAARRDADR